MIFYRRKNRDSYEARAYFGGNRPSLPVIMSLGISLPPEHELIRAPSNETDWIPRTAADLLCRVLGLFIRARFISCAESLEQSGRTQPRRSTM